MMHRRRLAWPAPCLALVLVTVAGCARDGSFEPRGSIKDTPAASPAGTGSKVSANRFLPKAVRKVTAPEERPEAAQVAPSQPPQTTSAPQLAPSPQAKPAPQAQPARRPPINGLQLLEEGRMLFRSGEVLAARERYVAALSAPLPDVLLELARTYDPNYLDRLPKTDADADLDRARALYEQASTLGSKPAETDLARLQGGAAPR